MTKTNTYRELFQRTILETCDLWDIWSDLQSDEGTLQDQKKDNDKDQDNDKDKYTFQERP